MIIGSVNSSDEAIVRLAVYDRQGRAQEIDAAIDTGFNGSLTLPYATISSLGLVWRNQTNTMLANGSMTACDLYAGVVLWDGQPRNILVEAADTHPLVGMDLVHGYELTIQAIDGGTVMLKQI